jgi:hypothetical protein
MFKPPIRFLPPTLLFSALCAASGTARAQFTFSIDYFGPTNGVPNSFGLAPIRPADILTPATGGIGVPGFPLLGPLPFPGTLFTGGAPGLSIPTYFGCVGAPPGIPCPCEVDALSYGTDAIPPLGAPMPPGTWAFSVDEFAIGIAGMPLSPRVASEGPTPGVFESGSDAFMSLGLPPAPVPPGAFSGNRGTVDGNGIASFSAAVYPGVGIKEPRPPMLGPGPRPGDDIDAFDFGPGPAAAGGIFFSLDAGFFDPLRGVPNTGSAVANGFLPGAILNVPAGGAAPVVWAGPILMGLDFGGPGSDDLDALAIRENGIPGYQGGPAGDLVRFSVRRGSFIIGTLDSLQLLPIEPGDILAPPAVAGATPQIIVCAEALGLATARSGLAPIGDDLDALDALNPVMTPLAFCEPAVSGVSACPCGNPGVPGAGCNNSSATGGAKLTAAGMSSLLMDTLVFTTSGEKPTALSIVLQGTAVSPVGLPFGQGVRCVAGSLLRLYTKSAVGGSITAPAAADPTVSARSAALGGPILPSTSRYYGVYYRDPIVLGGCPGSSTFNITNQLAVYWTP